LPQVAAKGPFESRKQLDGNCVTWRDLVRSSDFVVIQNGQPTN
jgi:hypothetical protein